MGLQVGYDSERVGKGIMGKGWLKSRRPRVAFTGFCKGRSEDVVHVLYKGEGVVHVQGAGGLAERVQGAEALAERYQVAEPSVDLERAGASRWQSRRPIPREAFTRLREGGKELFVEQETKGGLHWTRRGRGLAACLMILGG